MKDSGVIRR